MLGNYSRAPMVEALWETEPLMEPPISSPISSPAFWPSSVWAHNFGETGPQPQAPSPFPTANDLLGPSVHGACVSLHLPPGHFPVYFPMCRHTCTYTRACVHLGCRHTYVHALSRMHRAAGPGLWFPTMLYFPTPPHPCSAWHSSYEHFALEHPSDPHNPQSQVRTPGALKDPPQKSSRAPKI